MLPLLGLFFAPTAFPLPAVVCDAGSTGTRIYAFQENSEKVEMKLIGKITPGLSAFSVEKNLVGLVEALAPLINEGLEILGSASLHLLGTGGVRSLPPAEQTELWRELKRLLIPRLSPGFSGVTLNSIHGTAEAFYGLVSADYLFPGFGVLDLGGSSAEIAHAGADGILGSADDVLVTHGNLGTEKMRMTVGDACAPGLPESGFYCRLKITEVLKSQKIGEILKGGSQKFLGISAFVYSLDFASWLLGKNSTRSVFVQQYPDPSISAIREACHSVCALEVDTALFTQHRLTNAREADGRCFDICYVAELLTSFGLGDEESRVRFMLEVGGNEIEWTQGYYLANLTKQKSNEEL